MNRIRVNGGHRAAATRAVLDQYLPHFDASIRQGGVMPASGEDVHAWLRAFDFAQLWASVGRAMGGMRAVPGPLATAARKARWVPSTTSFVLDDALRRGVVLLAETPARHIVLGAVGKLWKADVSLLPLTAEEFLSFDQPKYVKALAGFLIRPYGRDRTLLKFESRFRATDDSARTHFQRRWHVVEPYATFFARRLLHALTMIAKEQRAASAPPRETIMTSIAQIWDPTVAKSNEWLEDVGRELGTENANTILLALRSVLHALRDRLHPDEAAQLAAHLPILLKGVYFDGWNPSATPVKARTKAEFTALAMQSMPPGTSSVDAERFIRAVFHVVAARVPPGEIRDVQALLPAELKTLWPEPVPRP